MLDDEAGNEKADEVDGVIDAGRQKVVCCCGCWSGGSLMKRQKVVVARKWFVMKKSWSLEEEERTYRRKLRVRKSKAAD